METVMAAQTREKKTAEDRPRPAPAIPTEVQMHPLAPVIGSFQDDLSSLDTIMAGVAKYRQRMEVDEQIP